jgi:hypothetical protein
MVASQLAYETGTAKRLPPAAILGWRRCVRSGS